MRLLSLLFLLLACHPGPKAQAQSSPDDWTLHLSYAEALSHVDTGSEIYALFSENLLIYDKADHSVRTIDKLTGLSDKGITHIGYAPSRHAVILLYKNNNVDFIDTRTGNIQNLPQVKDYVEESIVINDFQVEGDFVTLSTTAGIIILNIEKREVRGYYNLGKNVVASAVSLDGATVYAATSDALLCASMKSNLNVASSWETIRRSPAFRLHPTREGGLYAFIRKTEDGSGSEGGLPRLLHFSAPDTEGKRDIVALSNGTAQSSVYVGGAVYAIFDGAFRHTTAEEPLHFSTPASLPVHPTKVAGFTVTEKGECFFDEKTDGIKAYTFTPDDGFKPTGTEIHGYGPRRDLAYNLTFGKNRRLYVAGGRFDNFDINHFPGTLMALDVNSGDWTYFDKANDLSDWIYRDVMTVAEHPTHPEHLYVAAAGNGLTHYYEDKPVHRYLHDNSGLQSAAPASTMARYYVRVDGLLYDDKENLWLYNNGVYNPIRILRNDSTWFTVELPEINGHDHLERMLFDQNGALWGTSRISNSIPAGVFCFNYGGTIENPDDDKFVFRSQASNDDGTTVSLNDAYALTLDLAGQMWIGCAKGVFVVPQPADFLKSNATVRQPKVPRNDGTNYADYLLDNTPVSAIAVDAANRKWLGTIGSGIYLVSSDGTEVLEHYTADNSPLLSDIVYDIEIDHYDGKVYLATDGGLCSFRGTATQAADRLVESAVKVYPNPVRPDYHGRITVSGLTSGAEVRIVSTSAQLVARGSANGGAFVWDGRGPAGTRCAPGVYYVLVSDAEADKGVAAKFVLM